MVSNRPGDDRLRERGETPASSSSPLVEKTQELGGRLGEHLRRTGQTIAREQKQRASEELETISEVVHETAGRLHERDEHLVADYVEALADQLESAAEYVRGLDIRDVVDTVNQFARRRPEVVIGAALVGGLIAGRFLKATRRESSTGGQHSGGGQRPQDRGFESRTSEAGPIAPPPRSMPARIGRTGSTGSVGGQTGHASGPGAAPIGSGGGERIGQRDTLRTISREDARESGLHEQSPTRAVDRDPSEDSPGGRDAEPYGRPEPPRMEDER